MIKSVTKTVVMTAAVLLMMATAARASPIVHPDLTITDLVIAYDGTNLDVVSDPGGSILSWTLADGSPGGLAMGSASLTWNGTSGTFNVFDDALQVLLSGSIQSLIADLSGSTAMFDAAVLLSDTAFGLGDNVRVAIASTNYLRGEGTGQADVMPVPEPATLALLLAGGGMTAASRWRKSRRTRTPQQS